MTPSRSRVLLIYTGGTIGMTEDPATRSLVPINFDRLEDSLPGLKRLSVDVDVIAEFEPKDSSDIGPEDWLRFSGAIAQHYHHYDGFVVLHGTDTMAFTASAMSFLLTGLAKPVILTGAQLPLGRVRTDGMENLITAIQIAGDRDPDGPSIREVAVYFGSELYRGNRTHKSNTEHFDAIESANCAPLATAGIHVRYHDHRLKPKPTALQARNALNPNVTLVKVFPGMSADQLQHALAIPGIRCAVIESFGSGNLPGAPAFLQVLEAATNRNIWLINVTQCSTGFVEHGLYATSAGLDGAGLISGGDMTTEAALTKAMVLLEVCENRRDFEREFHRPWCGERTNSSVFRTP